MERIFLLIGSNIGDRHHQLDTAREFINERVAPMVSLSRIYESAPWGDPMQPYFLNQALELLSDMPPMQLLSTCLGIEKEMGRSRGPRYAARSIDIDILYYGAVILRNSTLQLPHPEIENRRFTLLPMVEIAPHWVHPLLHLSQLALLEKCRDLLAVEVLSY